MAEIAPGEEKGFAADDARLSAMHGYTAAEAFAAIPAAVFTPAVNVVALRSGDDSALRDREDVVAQLARLEGKVDALIVALRSGAVGKWTR